MVSFVVFEKALFSTKMHGMIETGIIMVLSADSTFGDVYSDIGRMGVQVFTFQFGNLLDNKKEWSDCYAGCECHTNEVIRRIHYAAPESFDRRDDPEGCKGAVSLCCERRKYPHSGR